MKPIYMDHIVHNLQQKIHEAQFSVNFIFYGKLQSIVKTVKTIYYIRYLINRCW